MKKLLFLPILFLLSCNPTDKKQSEKTQKPTVETYISETYIEPSYNGCCSFHTILQMNNRGDFSYYYLNDQGDYRRVDEILGVYERRDDSIYIFKQKKDSAERDFSYDSSEFFKNNFVKRGNNLISKGGSLRKISFRDVRSFSVHKTNSGDGDYYNVEVILKNDSLFYKSYSGSQNVTKKCRLTPKTVENVKSLFDTNFWTVKNPEKDEKVRTYSHIDFGGGDTEITLNPTIADYFLKTLVKEYDLENSK